MLLVVDRSAEMPARVPIYGDHCPEKPQSLSPIRKPMNGQLKIDVNAKEIAFNRWALSSCVHMPVAAISENAIEEYINNIVKIIRPGSPTRRC